MTFHPVLPPVLLTLVAAVVLATRAATAHRLLTSSRRTRMAVWRWAGVTVAAVLLLLAAVRPVFGDPLQTSPAGVADGQPNVFLVLDRSPEMGVTDASGGRTRMAAAREDAAAIVDRYPDARFALIDFATGPSLDWPLSQDTWSLRPALAGLEPYAGVDVAQTNVAAAGNTLRYQLIAAHQQFPRARTLVFYLGSGAAGSEAPQRRFDVAEGTVDGGAVLGYGTPGGGTVAGVPGLRSRIDEPALRGVAEQLGIPYVPRGQDGDTSMFDDAGDAAGPTAPVTATTRPTETYWAPAAVAAALLFVELVLVLRDFRRTRAPLSGGAA